MASAKRQVRGLNEFEQFLELVGPAINDALVEMIDDNAHDMLGRAQDLSPQLTGDHINSGTVSAPSKFVRVVTFSQPYSVRLHEGRYRLGPISSSKPSTEDGPVGRKYMQRPFDKHNKRWIREQGEAITGAIRRAVR